MGQFIAFIVILIIAKLMVDFFKEKITVPFQNKNSQTGEVIDISDAWVDTSSLPYKKKAQLINEKGRLFYRTLAEALEDSNYLICPHLQMSELITVIENPKQSEYAQRLKDRILDLVILEAATFKPVLVINLEESEPGKNRQISNRFTAKALQAADLPLMNINLNQMPKTNNLEQELRSHGLNI